MRRTIDVSHREIVRYWAAREDECGLSIDWAEACERCWRCGYRARLQRCHIVPHALGGSDDPENLVLLCGRCHREAPNVADSRFMWLWLRADPEPLYDSYWTQRGILEYERIFKRRAFDWIEAWIPEERIRNLLAEEIRNTVVHFGENGPNPSTIAWVISRVECRLLGGR